MPDAIALRGIRAYGKHGANPGERDYVQPFDLDLELDVDLSAPRASDALADTIDYAALHARVVRLVETQSFALLERLGETIVNAVMLDARIVAARLSLAKPGLLAGATPSVTLRADRASHPLKKLRKRLPPPAPPRRRYVGDPQFDPKARFLGVPAAVTADAPDPGARAGAAAATGPKKRRAAAPKAGPVPAGAGAAGKKPRKPGKAGKPGKPGKRAKKRR